MKPIFDESCVNMWSSSTQRARIKASINKFRSPKRVVKAMGRCTAATFSVESSTTTTATLRRGKPEHLRGFLRLRVRRKWTYQPKGQPGRPPIDAELEQWILRVAQDNPGLGYDKLKGELRKLGLRASSTTIRTVLLRHGIPPAPERPRLGSSWRTFLNHYKKQFLACDFLTVETLTLKTVYVLFFIEHATRRVYLAGCTAHPEAPGSPNKPVR